MKIKLLTFLFITTCGYLSAQAPFGPATVSRNASKWQTKSDLWSALKPSAPSTPLLTNLNTSRRYATCANRPGVLQLGLGYGATIGAGWMLVTDTGLLTWPEPGLGMGYHINFRAQYGITEGISLGCYLRKEGGVYSTTDVETFFNGFTVSGLGLGFEGKGYFVNLEKFAAYVAPSIGVSFGSATINDKVKNHTGKGGGFSYGGTLGLNWYWTEAFGMSFDFGYSVTSQNGIFDTRKNGYVDYEMVYGGMYVGTGLVLNFDTRRY